MKILVFQGSDVVYTSGFPEDDTRIFPCRLDFNIFVEECSCFVSWQMLDVLESKVLWVNPDCGLKTRKYAEVKPGLIHMVEAAKKIRAELACAK